MCANFHSTVLQTRFAVMTETSLFLTKLHDFAHPPHHEPVSSAANEAEIAGVFNEYQRDG